MMKIIRGALPRVTQKLLLSGGVICIVMAAGLNANAQKQTAPQLGVQATGNIKILDEVGPWKLEMLRQPGIVLAEGRNTSPVGSLRVKTYRIEEITLANPLHAEIDGRPAQVEEAWRISITGGPFRVRNAAPMIWIDDTLIGIGLESPDLKSISVVVFDRSLIKNGSSVSLSYGENDPARTAVPDKIELARTR